MRKNLFLLLTVFMVTVFNSLAQVGINTANPYKLTELQILNIVNGKDTIPKGIMIPRLTEYQRDKIDVSIATDANSLMIYNTTEDCYNYYSRLAKEWQSLCGRLGKAELTMDCSSILVNGEYLDKQSLNTSNYIRVTVTVTKPGSYSITAISNPDNGYYFSKSGEFLTKGTYTITLEGAGTPTNFTPSGGSGDLFNFYLNDIDSGCSTNIIVEDSSIKPDYTMDCRTTKVNGLYVQNKELDVSTNTITLYISVDASATGATYNISTDVVAGMSFSASGILVAGNQVITLLPNSGSIPSNAGEKTFVISSNSSKSKATCTATLEVGYPTRTILTLSDYWNTYCYGPGGTGNYSTGNAQTTKFMKTATNFGMLSNSIVKVDGLTIIGADAHTVENNATMLQNLIDTYKPSIIQYAVRFKPNQDQCNIFKKFVDEGGVLIAQSDNADGGGPAAELILNTIFGSTSIKYESVNGAGALYKLPTFNDEILNGAFGDARGRYWGEDASVTICATNVPSNNVIQYSSNEDWSQETQNWLGYTMLKHETLGFFWIGDGGFVSGHSGTSSTICPFKIDENNKNLPIPKQGYGRNSAKQPVYNSILFGNIMAWAIKTVQNN